MGNESIEFNLETFVQIIITLTILIAVFFVLSSNLPLDINDVGRDSGVFIYVGEQVLNGKTPYLDVWDHKGPLLYYINAFGLLLGDHTLYGLWIIQFAFIALSALVSFYLLRLSFGKIPAIIGTFFWLINLPNIIQGGNLTEEYALPFQFLAILFFLLSEKRDSVKYMLWAGIFIGLCAALKPNIIGIAISAAIYFASKGIITKEYHRPLKSITCMVIGAILPLLIYSLLFMLKGAMYDFFDQYLYYNLIYSTTPMHLKLESIRSGFNLINGSNFVIGGWVLTVMIIGLYGYKKSICTLIKEYPLIIFSGILFPLDLVLASGSGRSYGHYYMTWLPVFSLLFAILVWFILQLIQPEHKKISADDRMNKIQFLLIAILLPLLLYSCMATSIDASSNRYHQNHNDLEVISYIKENGHVSDKVLFWGAEAKFNVMLNRDTPSKYVYQYPFFMRGYAKQPMIDEFIYNLKSDPPEYIIDTSSTNSAIIPINQSKRMEWPLLQSRSASDIDFSDYFRFVNAHYRPIKTVPNKNWVIYELDNTINNSF